MLNPIDSIIEYISPQTALKRESARLRLRKMSNINLRFYDGARRSERTKNWHAPSLSAAIAQNVDFITLRNRARDLVRNNPIASRAVQVLVNSVCGPAGISPLFRCPSDLKRKQVEARWDEFASSESFDKEQITDFYEMQREVLSAMIIDGESIVRIWKENSDRLFTYQLLEGDYIDHLRTIQEGESQYSIMGVRINSDLKRVGYWLFEQHPQALLLTGKTPVSHVVPASEILHVFRRQRCGEVRGLSHFAACMLSIHDLMEFQASLLQKHLLEASITGTIIDEAGDPGFQEVMALTKVEEIKPASIINLVPGQKFEPVPGPSTDGSSYSAYMQQILRSISGSIGVSYEQLTNDYSQSNFSSSRLAHIESEKHYKSLRALICRKFIKPVIKNFLLSLEMNGIHTDDVSWTYSQPKRPFIDPKTEIEAAELAIANNLTSVTQTLLDMGHKPEVIFDQIRREQELFEKLNINKTSKEGKEQIHEFKSRITA